MYLEQFDKDLSIQEHSAKNILENTPELEGWVYEPTYESTRVLKRFFRSDTYIGTVDMISKIAGIFAVSKYYGKFIMHENGLLEIHLGDGSIITMADIKMAKEVNKYMKQFTDDIFPLNSKSNTI